jgi:pilus assembly protein CpaE
MPQHLSLEIELERLSGFKTDKALPLATGRSHSTMWSIPKVPDIPVDGALSIVLIGPNERRRQAVAGVLAGYKSGTSPAPQRRAFAAGIAIRELSSYSAGLDDLPEMMEQHCDVVMVDLDCDPEYALDVVERICALGSATLMVYSEQDDKALVVRAMRAGAREFLPLPLVPSEMADALSRVSSRRPATGIAKGTARRVFVFLGAKGGCGVTTLASNFAVLLAQESGQTTLLVDLGLPLGDAAINLGMVHKYSTVNAFQEPDRLDASFLATLLAKHSSGLYLLAAPGEFTSREAPQSAIDKLIDVARQSFDYIVVDAGSRVDLMDSALFEDSSTVYLVTQIGVSELRNANRMISKFFAARGRTLQIVLNRYIPHSMGVDEKHIAKALTRPAEWRIPDDFADARRTRNTATPLALKDSPISRAIRQMARTACGLPADEPKKNKLRLFG